MFKSILLSFLLCSLLLFLVGFFPHVLLIDTFACFVVFTFCLFAHVHCPFSRAKVFRTLTSAPPFSKGKPEPFSRVLGGFSRKYGMHDPSIRTWILDDFGWNGSFWWPFLGPGLGPGVGPGSSCIPGPWSWVVIPWSSSWVLVLGPGPWALSLGLGACPWALSSGLVLGPCPWALSSGLVLGACPWALSSGLVLGPCPWALLVLGPCPRALSSGLVLGPCPWALSFGPLQNVTQCQTRFEGHVCFRKHLQGDRTSI